MYRLDYDVAVGVSGHTAKDTALSEIRQPTEPMPYNDDLQFALYCKMLHANILGNDPSYCAPPLRREGAFWNSAIRPSVCPMTQLPRYPYSITERRVPELIPVLGSQPAGDVSHKPGGRLPLLSTRPAVTQATLKRAATNFAAW